MDDNTEMPMAHDSPNPLPCFVCGKELVNVSSVGAWDGDYLLNQPYDATAFHTSGHYGSTLFDSFTGNQWELAICNDCMAPRFERTRVLVRAATRAVTWAEYRK